MRTSAARLLAVIGMLVTLMWAAMPAVALSDAAARSETSDCGCCETAMLAAGMVCPGCQSGVHAERAMPAAPAVTAIAWLAPPVHGFVGIAPAPADPPPR